MIEMLNLPVSCAVKSNSVMIHFAIFGQDCEHMSGDRQNHLFCGSRRSYATPWYHNLSPQTLRNVDFRQIKCYIFTSVVIPSEIWGHPCPPDSGGQPRREICKSIITGARRTAPIVTIRARKAAFTTNRRPKHGPCRGSLG